MLPSIVEGAYGLLMCGIILFHPTICMHWCELQLEHVWLVFLVSILRLFYFLLFTCGLTMDLVSMPFFFRNNAHVGPMHLPILSHYSTTMIF